MEGYKHLIQCHCMLPQYRNYKDPIFHKFTVFSVVDDSGTVIAKNCQCENCGVIHKVYDICMSEIASGKDESKSVITKKDLVYSIPKQLSELFEEYQLGVADYEAAKFYIENEKWGSTIVLTREIEEEGYSGKFLTIVGPEKFKIEPYFDRNVL